MEKRYWISLNVSNPFCAIALNISTLNYWNEWEDGHYMGQQNVWVATLNIQSTGSSKPDLISSRSSNSTSSVKWKSKLHKDNDIAKKK